MAEKKKRRIVAKTLLAVIGIWVAGDFLYSRVISRQAAAWEKTVERDENGVLAGCDAYDVAPATDVPPRGALLLVHGINASPRHYDKLAPALAAEGFHCRAMRLPGFAMPLETYADSRHEAWVDSIEQELARLRPDHDRVGVVAHSLGGATVIGHFLRRPDSADFVALLAPATAVSSARSPVLPVRWWHEFAKGTVHFTTTLRSPFGIDSHDPANQDFPGRVPFAPRAIVDELFTLMDSNWARVGEFQTPMLMVLTEDDRVIDWQSAKRFYDEAPSPTKELLMLENSGHAIPIDYNWPQVAEAIVAFADRVAEGEGNDGME